MKSFTVDQSAAVLDNAYQLALVARAAYCDDPAEDNPAFDLAYKRVIPFSYKRSFGLVAGTAGDVVLAFRGTDEYKDWIEALAFSQTDLTRGRAHMGLSRQLDGLWSYVLAAFYDVEAMDKPIWVTGHSLGGALATLAALRLSEEGFDVHMTCTYGAPKVLDPRAAQHFDTPLYRFVNNEDPVPDVPWPTPFDTYAHVGELKFLLPSGRIAEKRHSPGLARLIDRAASIGKGIFPAGVFHDHNLDTYIEKLELHLSEPPPEGSAWSDYC